MTEHQLPPRAIAQQSAALNPLGEIILGYGAAQVLNVAAKLGLADLLAAGPRDTASLAEESGTHAPSLARLLRALAALGVVMQHADGFALTDLGHTLRADMPGSIRDWALFLAGEWMWSSWGGLITSVRTGEPAFDRLFGMSNFEYWEHDAEAGAIHDAYFTTTSRSRDAAVLSAFDFSRFGTVVDVAGSQGALLAAILAAHPNTRGVLFDLPHVVVGARPVLEAAGVADRCQTVGGSFFESVPAGGDAYVLMQILHDWDDGRALQILRSCRAAMAPGAMLVVIDRIVPERIEAGPRSRQITTTDLIMLVLTPGGRERTENEVRSHLRDAGFALRGVTPTKSPVSIIEAVAV